EIKNSTKNEYDCKLENMKIEVMNIWIKLLGEKSKCYWIEDSQSHKLSVEAYSKINFIENKLRTFISIILIRIKGMNWDEDLKDTLLSSKNNDINHLGDKFKRVDLSMFSLDMRDLSKIMNHRVIKPNLT